MKWPVKVILCWFIALIAVGLIVVVGHGIQFFDPVVTERQPRVYGWAWWVFAAAWVAFVVRGLFLAYTARKEALAAVPACPYCRYVPDAASAQCPECGRPYSVEAARSDWKRVVHMKSVKNAASAGGAD